MPIFGRREGKLVRNASPIRMMMPYLMRGRNEAAVYFTQELDLTKTLKYIEEQNEGLEEKKVSFLQIYLCAIARTLGIRQQLNRFVVGSRLYQRNNIEISFAVKKRFEDSARITTVKISFSPDETLDSLEEKLKGAIQVGRGDKKTGSEVEVGLLMYLPRFVLKGVMWLQRTLDYFNILPYFMIKDDPLYASMFIANLGSIGLDAPYHHLFEYGTIPLFAVIGRIQKTPKFHEDGSFELRDTVKVKYTYDERIADGFYCASSLDILKELIENPEQLETPPEKGVPATS